MANIKSQIKRNRQNEARRLRNKAVRSEMKTRTKPLFVLTRTIRMPKRPFMRPAIQNRENVAAITKAFAAGFKRELRRGFKVLVTGSDAA